MLLFGILIPVLPFCTLMFSPVVLSPPTWSNSAELGAEDILKNCGACGVSPHCIMGRRSASSAQTSSTVQHENKRWMHMTGVKRYAFPSCILPTFMLSLDLIRSSLSWFTSKWDTANSSWWSSACFLFLEMEKSNMYLECRCICQELAEVSTVTYISKGLQWSNHVGVFLMRLSLETNPPLMPTVAAVTSRSGPIERKLTKKQKPNGVKLISLSR